MHTKEGLERVPCQGSWLSLSPSYLNTTNDCESLLKGVRRAFCSKSVLCRTIQGLLVLHFRAPDKRLPGRAALMRNKWAEKF